MSPRNAKLTKCRSIIALVAFVAMAVSGLLISTTTSAAPPKTKIDTPNISCAGSGKGFIDIQVCAPSGTGATGLPAGFSIQWMTCADFHNGPDGILGTADDNSWPSDSDCVTGPCQPSFCKASFSGNANLSRYNLNPGDCVTVRIGDLLLDNGASTNCPDVLHCGTCYEFRAFGHAKNPLNRSVNTGNLECSTKSCGDTGGGCTLTQGWWKTHGEGDCAVAAGAGPWPSGDRTLGNRTYTDAEWCSIFKTPTGGNGLIALAHQLMAAKLNLANGAGSCKAVEDAIAAADLLIGNKVVPPVGTDSVKPGVVSAFVLTLDNYNNGEGGEGCPTHCDKEVTP